MSQAQILGARLVAENRLKQQSLKTTEDILALANAYQNLQGLSTTKYYISRFLDAFPYNIIVVFSFFLVLMIALNAVVGRLTKRSARPQEALAADRLRLLAALERARYAQDADAAASAQVALAALDAEERAPSELQSSLMTVFSLVIAIGGIFSLPLITSASIRLSLHRLTQAREFVTRT